jgi:hypothetical protein
MIRLVPWVLGGNAERAAERRKEKRTAMWHYGVLELFLIVFVCVWIVVGIFYCLTLQKALSRCSPQNRTLSPGLVWLLLIPIFGLIWHFFIVINMAKSLHAEFVSRNILEEQSPGQGIGLAVCILHVVAVVLGFHRFLGPLVGIAGLICWIVYWVKIAGFSSKIAIPYKAVEPPAGAASA